jgi:cleavage and polyadenylation specificity factor subunit 4
MHAPPGGAFAARAAPVAGVAPPYALPPYTAIMHAPPGYVATAAAGGNYMWVAPEQQPRQPGTSGGYRAPGAPLTTGADVMWVSASSMGDGGVHNAQWNVHGYTGSREGGSGRDARAAPAPAKTSGGSEASTSRNAAMTNAKSSAKGGGKKNQPVTFPTVDEIPVVKPVDVSTLPEDVRKYREERAKHWPSDRNVQAKDEAGEDLAREKELRRARLREILAKQRELGHFEASQEIGEDGSGALSDGEKKPTTKRAREDTEGREDTGDEKKVAEENATVSANRVCRFWLSGGCRKGSACDFKHESAPGNESRCRFFAKGYCKAGAKCPFKHEARTPGENNRSRGANASSSVSQQTLLKKLLSKEIETDQSRLLQLFRFFVNNDFFIGAKGNTEACWMFPWVDEVKIIDKKMALSTLPPVYDDEDDVDEEEVLAAKPEERAAPAPNADLGFFSMYDNASDSDE